MMPIFPFFFFSGCGKIAKSVGLRLDDFDVIVTYSLVDGIALG
jgi:hypothetical protein